MKIRAKSKFRRLLEIAVLMSIASVSALTFHNHQSKSESAEAAAPMETEALVQRAADTTEHLVKNGPVYLVEGLKAAYNPDYTRLDAVSLILAKDPDNIPALQRRAGLLVKLELPEEALLDVNRLIELRPDVSINYYRRAFIYMDLENWEEAKPDLERYMADEREDEAGKLANSYSYVLARLGEFEKALPFVEESISKEKSYHNLDTLGYVLVGLERYEEAAKAYDEALKFDPDETYALRGRAVAYRGLGDLEKSQADLAAQAAIDPNFCLHWEKADDPGSHDDEEHSVLDGSF